MAGIAIGIAAAVVQGVIVHVATKKIDQNDVPVPLDEAKIWLEKMEDILSNSDKMQAEGGSNLPLYYVKQVQNLAYAIEDALDDFMFDVLQHENNPRYKVIQRLIKRKPHGNFSSKMNSILNNKISAQILQAQPQPPSSSSCERTWSGQYLADGDEVLGFEVYEEQLCTELKKQPNENRRVILIAGPGGSGKSTLVNKVYQSHRIHEHGGDSIVKDWVELPKISKEDARAKCLQGSSAQGQEKFLVVLDDVWNKEDLKDIVYKVPHVNIVITSRRSAVASILCPNHVVIDLSCGLSSEKAKELFCKKAFPDQGNWPSELDEWDQKNPEQV